MRSHAKKMYRTEQSLCSFDIKKNENDTKKTSLTFVTLSSFAIPSRPCRCKTRDQHQFDLTTYPEMDNQTKRISLIANFYEAAMPNWFRDIAVTITTPPGLKAPTQESGRNEQPDAPVTITTPPGLHKAPTHVEEGPGEQQQAYPTLAREAEKARLKAGHIPKKQIKFIEPATDDLGDDLNGLGGNIELYAADTVKENMAPIGPCSEWHLTDVVADDDFTAFDHRRDEPCIIMLAGDSIDDMELNARFFPRHGEPVDRATRIDLTDKHMQQQFLEWYQHSDAMLTVLNPTATNEPSQTNLDAWLACGQVALYAHRNQRKVAYFMKNKPTLAHVSWSEITDAMPASQIPDLHSNTWICTTLQFPALKHEWACKACRHRHHRSRASHTRVEGECEVHDWPDREPAWTCPGCRTEPIKPRDHPSHIGARPGECRWEAVGRRVPHIRPLRRREPSGPARPQPRGEAHIPAREHEVPAAGLRSADFIDPDAEPPPAASADRDPEHDPEARGSADPAPPRQGRGPDLGPRQPYRSRADAATGENPPVWTRFDVTKVLASLKSTDHQIIARNLRKLHLRWWHASRSAMERVLHAAGVPLSTLQLIPDIIDTCRECRVWQPHGPKPTPTVELTMNQNEVIEADLMFVDQYIIWHMIDRADRWHAACTVSGKTPAAITAAIDKLWISIHGPFKVLIADGERALITAEAGEFLSARGIRFEPKAPSQHAHMIERRTAILRHQIHAIMEETKNLRYPVEFDQILAQAVFAGNSMLAYNGATPYNARFGRQPAILPEIEDPDHDPNSPGAQQAHIRRVALHKIIEATAEARINRAFSSVTTIPGEVLNFQSGEKVDFWRSPMTKDTPAWHGPAEVIKNDPSNGQVQIRWKGRHLYCRYADVRRHMAFAGLTTNTPLEPTSQFTALKTIHNAVATLAKHRILHIGYTSSNSNWHMTNDTKTNPRVALAADFVARNLFHLNSVYAVKIGYAISKLPRQVSANASVLVWWFNNPLRYESIEFAEAPSITLADHIGEDWQQATTMQFLQREQCDINLTSAAEPGALPTLRVAPPQPEEEPCPTRSRSEKKNNSDYPPSTRRMKMQTMTALATTSPNLSSHRGWKSARWNTHPKRHRTGWKFPVPVSDRAHCRTSKCGTTCTTSLKASHR